MTRWVSVGTAAGQLGVSRWTIWRLAVKKNLIAWRKVGFVLQVSMESVEDYLTRQSRPAPAAPESTENGG